ANTIQKPSSNPYYDLKAAILQYTQLSATERVQKLLQQQCLEDLRPIALVKLMKLLVSGESFETEFWKLLYFEKLPSYMQPISAKVLKTKLIESLAEMADNIAENVESQRIKEIHHTPQPTSTKNERNPVCRDKTCKPLCYSFDYYPWKLCQGSSLSTFSHSV
ncbi:unnamed protein product, partial [Hymenolepis diminuta]